MELNYVWIIISFFQYDFLWSFSKSQRDDILIDDDILIAIIQYLLFQAP